MRFAVSSYSFSQAIRSGNMTQADCVEKAKEMGFEGVEFTDLAGGSLEEQKKYAFEIKERASKAGIEVVAYTIGAILYGVGVKKRWMHSVFHIFVVIGSLLQFFAIYRYIL